MTTQSQLDDESSLILPWVFPYVSTCSATGDTTYLVDTNIWQDTNAIIYLSQSLNSCWIYRPDASAAGDRERQIGGNTGNALDLTNGRIYPIKAWTNAPANAERYLITTIQPTLLFNLSKAALHRFPLPTLRPLGVFSDSDMATSGTTNYTISGAGAISKVTAAANVNLGTQSLFFNAATAGEYVESPAIRVATGQQYFASVNIRVDAGGPFAFAIYDNTNGAEIDSSSRVSTSHEQWRSLRRLFTPPSGCEEVTLRVYCTNATDDAYINYFSGPWKSSDRVFNFTSLINRGSQVRKLLTASYQHDPSGNVRDATTRAYTEIERRTLDYDVRVNLADVHPTRLEFKPYSSVPLEELFIEQIIRADAYYTLAFTAAGETSPDVAIDKRHWALARCRDVCTHVLSGDRGHEAAKASRDEIDAELEPLMKDYAQQDLETTAVPPRMAANRIGAL